MISEKILLKENFGPQDENARDFNVVPTVLRPTMDMGSTAPTNLSAWAMLRLPPVDTIVGST